MKSNPESLVDRASGRNLPRSSSVRGVWPRLGYRIRIPSLMSWRTISIALIDRAGGFGVHSQYVHP